MPPDLLRAFLVSQSASNYRSSAGKRKTFENNMEIVPPFKFCRRASECSAVYFPNERSKFDSKVAVKDSQDCDAIL